MPEGKDSPKCTHVVMTLEELNDLETQIENGKAQLQTAVSQHNETLKTAALKHQKEMEKLSDTMQSERTEKGYDTIWFCRTVEEVYLGKIVSDNEKRKEMMKYIRTHDNDLAIMNKPTTKHKYNSNQIVVLDLYLNKK